MAKVSPFPLKGITNVLLEILRNIYNVKKRIYITLLFRFGSSVIEQLCLRINSDSYNGWTIWKSYPRNIANGKENLLSAEASLKTRKAFHFLKSEA